MPASATLAGLSFGWGAVPTGTEELDGESVAVDVSGTWELGSCVALDDVSESAAGPVGSDVDSPSGVELTAPRVPLLAAILLGATLLAATLLAATLLGAALLGAALGCTTSGEVCPA